MKRQNATTASGILEMAALISLATSVCWWTLLFAALIEPAYWTDYALTVLMAASYSIVLPMLISLLAPSTPAGQLLAETKWRTIGHALAVASVLFLSYHAFSAIWAWWQTRPAAVAAGQDLFLAIGTLIVFLVVPALSWAQVAPDRWVAEVVQAQQVRRLRAAQAANVMAAQVQYARAMALLKRGLANATAAERAELAGTLVAMQRAENEAISQVADQLRIITGIDSGVTLLDDDRLLDQYDHLTGQLTGMIAPVAEADYVTLSPRATAAPTADTAPHATNDAPPVTTHSNALQRAATTNDGHATVAHGDTPRRTVAHGGETYSDHQRAARAAVGATWTVKQISTTLAVSESQAREMVTAWYDAGQVDKTNLRGHYTWR